MRKSAAKQILWRGHIVAYFSEFYFALRQEFGYTQPRQRDSFGHIPQSKN